MDAADALEMWVAEGEIDQELADRLSTSLAAHEEPVRANAIIWVLVSIGAVLIGGGLLLFIASQWDQSAPMRRLGLLLVTYLLVVGSAALAERQRLAITARGLWFLSSIAVGVNIFLTGQIFNLSLNYWHGTLLWMIATLAMGWASPSSAQGWLVVPLGILTLGWISTPSSEFFDQGAFLWEPGGILGVLSLLGVGLIAIALLVQQTDLEWLERPTTAFGMAFVAIPLTVSTFHPAVFAWIFGLDFGLFHLVLILAVVGLVAVVWRTHRDSPLGIAFVAVAGLLVLVLPQVADDESRFDESTVSWLAPSFDDSEALFFGYNAVIFGFAVGVIVLGQRHSIRYMVNVGFGMVSVLLAAVYIGRIAGALPTSLAVILGGLVLVGGAIFLERKRREVTAEVTRESIAVEGSL